MQRQEGMKTQVGFGEGKEIGDTKGQAALRDGVSEKTRSW